MKQITPEDYRHCITCNETFDYWKYDSIKDSGHEGHNVREVTEEEFKTAVESCVRVGCFEENHLDSTKNRQYRGNH